MENGARKSPQCSTTDKESEQNAERTANYEAQIVEQVKKMRANQAKEKAPKSALRLAKRSLGGFFGTYLGWVRVAFALGGCH